ncbi:HAMP domain-containing sensor histidine kinase [Pelagicoccus sp. SDUM812002]|uniref:sensor histidine kinase n=1 Tax=Pelagicoccus sp. SDUM812002 TaxID=3041266 RepID=UPI00280EF343|nr:HAMP domain-containing sensor histidine kinase [Pelagicoccus sp. SDUM812002]MDQ8185314.1 HAMP domain-containing sensor histidine kinase [Pelagicoccus sp. SDUM812002]
MHRMFGRTGNAKPSVIQASAWVTYLLLGIGIFSPVFCVIWLVQKTVESENALVRQLVEEAKEQSLIDTADLVRLTALGMVPSPQNNGVRYSWNQTDEKVAMEDAKEAKEKVAEIRERVSRLTDKEAQDKLAELIVATDFDQMRLIGGRSLDLVLVELGISRIKKGGEIADSFLEAVDALILREMSEGSPNRQLRYVLRRYAEVSSSSEIQRLAEAEQLVDRWLEFVRNTSSWPPPSGLGRGDGFFYSVAASEDEVLIFPNESLVRASQNLESLHNNRFTLGLDGGEVEGSYRLRAPLDFLYLQPQMGAEFSDVASGKAVLYIWIGGIVLGLSVLSGAVIVFSVRRQASVTQLKDNLVATVTHELKTPVSSIRLLVDTLMDETRREKVNTQEYIELISRENQRLGRLIDNFLSFSRMERSKGSFDISRTPVTEVLVSAEEAFRERFKGQRFELEVRRSEKVPDIAGDMDALATVLGNLLENAFKYGGKDRRIILRAKRSAHGADFEVQDFGPGIGKRDQKRIFRKFFQLDRNASVHSGSVGLGLSIVDFVVSKHGGKIELESEVGKGSTFRVRIPYA